MESRNPYAFPLKPELEDIHLARATKSKPTEPAYYHQIFEHGIDPDVDDPSKCHDHSELPDVFPCLGDILLYRERLHPEMFLFMTIQSPNILPLPGLPRPDFAKLAKEAASRRLRNPWIKVPKQTFTIGYHEPESNDGPSRFFAWDNEHEPYKITVPQIEAQGRPVSNGEYAKYLVDVKELQIPATWSKARDARSDEDYTTFNRSSQYQECLGTTDFMDEKHLGVVGGSRALHPRIAGRKSFLNWWQKKYLWP
ncbi:DUF323 domain-containing [Fusarium acutatum]|uniref:DUF323 domain-containing n=1 Tax=Fusarium acutatum TaxID=78861 RepID=A0A8H4JA41_9HYPO|nr:DUF323 domain-containing [Fusarium acutatum]